MTSLLYSFYNIAGLPFIMAASRLAAVFNPKIRRGLEGRKSIFKSLEKDVESWKTGNRFWIHNSSMGEFEQAKPIVAELKRRFPDCRIVVTFFSPSGYDHVHDYDEADVITYLPIDTRRNIARFLDLARPDVVLVIRHDFWPNQLKMLNERGIPAILVNSSIRHQKALRIPVVLHANRFLFGCFDEVLTVSDEAVHAFKKFRLGRAKVSRVGDTRYDQVVHRAKTAEEIVAPLRKMKGDKTGFVMGSTWPSDEDVLLEALCRLKTQNLLPWMVMVPHEPTEEHLTLLEDRLRECGIGSHRLSHVESEGMEADEVLLVDRIGILASLYALGEITYVGGGFGAGVHNVLEPAALGKVVLYGPRSTNSYEAGQLAEKGVGFVIPDSVTMYQTLFAFLQDAAKLGDLGRKAAALVEANVGATFRIVDHITGWIKDE